MNSTETYNGWTNRETWLVALWINNEQGWQESVHEDIREGVDLSLDPSASHVGNIVRANVENVLDMMEDENGGRSVLTGLFGDLLGTALARVDWHEIGSSFLATVQEIDAHEANR